MWRYIGGRDEKDPSEEDWDVRGRSLSLSFLLTIARVQIMPPIDTQKGIESLNWGACIQSVLFCSNRY
jgi:hypothetical protein